MMHVPAHPDYTLLASLHGTQVPVMLAELLYMERRRQDRKLTLAVGQNPDDNIRFKRAAASSATA